MIEALIQSLRQRPCAFVLALVVTFAMVPSLDLAFSGLFYRAGEGFFWRYAAPFEFVRRALPPLAIGIVGVICLAWLAGALLRERILGVDNRVGGFLVGSLLLGPGLLVNTLFKDNWGRARPSTIVEFGGSKIFTPPLMIAGQCDRNCSFVSGHAALAFWSLAFALMAPPRWRMRAVVGAVAFGLLVGLVRVIQGAHFLSDVLYSGVVVGAVTVVLYRFLLTRRSAPGAP
ncbi:MAG: phosphatase PAP2 family protein [Alphaproteobacteria bacterium]